MAKQTIDRDNTNWGQQADDINAMMTELYGDYGSIFNVTTLVPLTAGSYYDINSARTAVPTSVRRIGLIITYLTATTEVCTLTITAAATVSDTIVVTLNGVNFSVTVNAGDSAVSIATKIKATIFSGWVVSGATGTAIVTFSKLIVGECSTPIYAANASGSSAIFVRTIAGTNEIWHKEQFIGSSIDNWLIDKSWLIDFNSEFKRINQTIYGLSGQTSGDRLITTAGLGGGNDVLAGLAGKTYSTKVAVTFTNTTGLTSIKCFVGTTVILTKLASEIVIGKEVIMQWSGVATAGSLFASQFRLQCDGIVNVAYTIRYIVVYEGLLTANDFTLLESANWRLTNYALIAAKATSATTATDASFANTLQQNEVLPVVHADQLNSRNWTFTSGGSVADSHVTIKANGSQAKLTIPSAVTSGSKYIFIVNLAKLNWLNIEATSLKFYNHSQQLTSLEILKSNGAVNILNYAVFTATTTGVIQILVAGANVNNSSIVPSGTNLVEFDTNLVCICPWTQAIEDLMKKAILNYSEGKVTPIVALKSLSSESLSMLDDSFNKIIAANNRITKINNGLVTDYSNGSGANVSNTTTYNTNNIVLAAECSAAATYPYVYNFGFRVESTAYATKAKTFVLVCVGSFIGTNTKTIILRGGSNGGNTLLVQDMVDNISSSFKGLAEITYPLGYTGNDQYFYLTQTVTNYALNQVINYTLTTFAIFEKVEGWNIDDYIANANKTIYKPIYLPASAASTAYVDNEIDLLKTEIAQGGISSPYSASYDKDVNMLIMYGQSLSVGTGATDSNSNMRKTLSFIGGCNEWASNLDITDPAQVAAYYGSDLVLLSSLTNKVFPPVAAASLAWMQLLEDENNVDLSNFDYQFLLSTPGYSGAAISQFAKGTTYYNRLLFSIQKGFNQSLRSSKTFQVPVLFWVQGEANRLDTQASYYAALNQLFIDLNTDIKAITGQSNDVQFITYQCSPCVGVTDAGVTYTDWGPAFAQLQLAIDKENVHLGGAMYQFGYSDIYHPLDRAVIGHQMGIQAKRIINDEKPLPVFRPISHVVQNDGTNYILSIKFDVPVKPMRFDVSGDAWHNVNGKQTNFGFNLLNSSLASIIAAEPVIKRGDTLVIKCTQNPIGSKLSYALNGHYGGGNLCDSQNIIINNKNTNYVVDNFCPAFREYTI